MNNTMNYKEIETSDNKTTKLMAIQMFQLIQTKILPARIQHQPLNPGNVDTNALNKSHDYIWNGNDYVLNTAGPNYNRINAMPEPQQKLNRATYMADQVNQYRNLLNKPMSWKYISAYALLYAVVLHCVVTTINHPEDIAVNVNKVGNLTKSLITATVVNPICYLGMFALTGTKNLVVAAAMKTKDLAVVAATGSKDLAAGTVEKASSCGVAAATGSKDLAVAAAMGSKDLVVAAATGSKDLAVAAATGSMNLVTAPFRYLYCNGIHLSGFGID